MFEHHDAHGYWLAEAGQREAAPALESERTADVVVVGGGYTGLWTAWHVKQLHPEAEVAVIEADGCGEGPSRPQRRLRQRALVQPPEPARALRRHGRGRGGPSGAALCDRDRQLLPRAGGRRLVPARRLSAGFDRAGLGRRLGCGPAGLQGGRRAGCLRRARRGRGPAPLRLADLPRRRVLCRRGDRAAGPPRPGAGAPRARARRPGVRADQGHLGAPPWPRCGRRVQARAGAREGRGARDRWSARPPSGHAPSDDRDLEPHRDHRAGARAARADRLDRGRVHHRLAGDDPLLPHDSGRTDRVRLGRGPDRLRGADARPRRARPGGRRRGPTPPASASSPGSRASGSSTRGAGRSTSRRPTCR